VTWWVSLSALACVGLIVTTTVFALLVEALREEWQRIEHEYWAWIERHRLPDEGSDDWPAPEGRS